MSVDEQRLQQMMSRYTVQRLVAEMKRHQKICDTFLQELIIRAALQEHSEQQFDKLASVAQEGVDLVSLLKKGDRIDEEWIDKRNWLVEQAQRLIDDAPDAMEEKAE